MLVPENDWTPGESQTCGSYSGHMDLRKRGQTRMLCLCPDRLHWRVTMSSLETDARKETCISYRSTYHLGNRDTGPVTGLVECLCANGTFYPLFWGHLPHPFCLNAYSTQLQEGLSPQPCVMGKALIHNCWANVMNLGCCVWAALAPLLATLASVHKLLKSLHSKTWHRARL